VCACYMVPSKSKLIIAYGKYTASTTAAHDALRYTRLTTLMLDSSYISIRHAKHAYLVISILLSSMIERVAGLKGN